MDLRPRLHSIPMTIRELQERIGWKSFPSLYDRIVGNRPIGLVLARRIEAATDGIISVASILNINIPDRDPTMTYHDSPHGQPHNTGREGPDE